MPIVLDPSKNFVAIQIMYVEEKDEKHGNSTYKFIGSRTEFENWKKKGYSTIDELQQHQQLESTKKEADKPGMPLTPPPNPNKIIMI